MKGLESASGAAQSGIGEPPYLDPSSVSSPEALQRGSADVVEEQHKNGVDKARQSRHECLQDRTGRKYCGKPAGPPDKDSEDGLVELHFMFCSLCFGYQLKASVYSI